MGSATVGWAGGGMGPSGMQDTTKVQGAEWGLKWFCGLAVGWVPVECKPQPASREMNGACNGGVGWRWGGTTVEPDFSEPHWWVCSATGRAGEWGVTRTTSKERGKHVRWERCAVCNPSTTRTAARGAQKEGGVHRDRGHQCESVHRQMGSAQTPPLLSAPRRVMWYKKFDNKIEGLH